MMKRLTGSGSLGPSSSCSQILVCMGRREERGHVPSAWNALPPLLHLANSYSSFKTRLQRHLLQEAFPDFSLGLLPLCSPVCPASLCLSSHHAVCCCFSLSLLPPADCELLEGRDQCHVPVGAQCCVRQAPSGCGECLGTEQCGQRRREGRKHGPPSHSRCMEERGGRGGMSARRSQGGDLRCHPLCPPPAEGVSSRWASHSRCPPSCPHLPGVSAGPVSWELRGLTCCGRCLGSVGSQSSLLTGPCRV